MKELFMAFAHHCTQIMQILICIQGSLSELSLGTALQQIAF